MEKSFLDDVETLVNKLSGKRQTRFKKKAEKHFPSLGEGTLSGVIVDCCTETGLAKNINSFVMGGVLQNTI